MYLRTAQDCCHLQSGQGVPRWFQLQHNHSQIAEIKSYCNVMCKRSVRFVLSLTAWRKNAKSYILNIKFYLLHIIKLKKIWIFKFNELNSAMKCLIWNKKCKWKLKLIVRCFNILWIWLTTGKMKHINNKWSPLSNWLTFFIFHKSLLKMWVLL